MKHFLKENDFSDDEILEVFDRASHLKQNRKQRLGLANDLAGQTWGLLFYKNSTRTRVSFEVGINELGGNALVLDQQSPRSAVAKAFTIPQKYFPDIWTV